MSGTLYGIGIGPGDPELITLKALRLIRAAPVLAYPAPDDGASLARAIAAPHLPGGQIEVPIRMPIHGGPFPLDAVYDAAAATLSEHLSTGRDVAVLCEGDPFFYGSFIYLYARIVDRFRCEVVPGISSPMACAAALGAPLAARNDALTVLPAPLPEAELSARIAASEAVAIIKVGRHLPKVRRVLVALGLADRARYVERATLPDQRILPLAEVPADAAPYFSMILAHRRGEAWR